MFDFAAASKWIAILAIISVIGYGVKWTYNKHEEAIVNAVNVAKLEAEQERITLVNEITKELKMQNEMDKAVLEAELVKTRAKVSNLQKMLLIDHDLDRLLQEKPGLILPRVNEGTRQAIENLGELTK